MDNMTAEELRSKYKSERDKRLRPDGETQFADATGDLADFSIDPYVITPIERDPVDSVVDVAIVGGGFGGLITAALLTKAGVDNFTIIDKAADFGGAWYWNRYPGIRCDIEAYCYLPLLEDVGTVPKEHYSTGQEIFEHSQTLGRHFDLYRRALLQTNVTSIIWDEACNYWVVSTNRGDRICAKFVSVSQGPLSKIKLPGIPGINDFKGKIFHSARWDYKYTGGQSNGELTGLHNKRVGIIGTGASAVQIFPELAKYAKDLFLFQRTPSSIDKRGNRATDTKWFKSLPKGWQRPRMDNFLSILTVQPFSEDLVNDSWTDLWKRFAGRLKSNVTANEPLPPPAIMQEVEDEKMNEIRARVSSVVKKEEVAEALKPWYNYLCKRPLYSDSYLQAFNRDNVHLIDTVGSGVTSITETGAVANGEEFPLDCIIFATGFDVGAAAHTVGGYELIGRNNLTLNTKWTDGMRSLHGTQFKGFPNFHVVGGVAQGITTFNFTSSLMIQAEHAVDLISGCLKRGVKSMEVTQDAEERWLQTMENNHVDHSHYEQDCTPGFLNNEGDVDSKPSYIGSTYGGGPLEYEQILRTWRSKHLEQDCTFT